MSAKYIVSHSVLGSSLIFNVRDNDPDFVKRLAQVFFADDRITMNMLAIHTDMEWDFKGRGVMDALEVVDATMLGVVLSTGDQHVLIPWSHIRAITAEE